MSFTSPFLGFVDAINNNQVKDLASSRRLNYYYPHHQLITSTSPPNVILQTKDRSGLSSEWSDAIIPSTDVLEHEKNYELTIAVPGIKDKNDINIEYHKEANQIVVSGEIPSMITEENKNKMRVREVASGKFKRVIRLPSAHGIDSDNIKATYTNGILKLNLPRLEPTQVKRIPISSKL